MHRHFIQQYVTRQLLYLLVSNAGAPVFIGAVNNGQQVSGDKIVRHVDTGGEAFFISGYIDVPTATGALNRQILIADLTETGRFVSAFHIGDAGTETANDLIFKYLGGTNYSLYLTGSTNSYTSIKSDVYYLQLNDSAGVMSLAEFSIFPAPTTSYDQRTGVEIKKAGKNRFAILENAMYTVTDTTSQSRNFTNVLVRDLNDQSGSCIKQFKPPVTRYTLNINQYACENANPGIKLYSENYSTFLKVFLKPQCGTLFLDAPNAGTVSGNPDQVARQAINTPTTIAAGVLRAYPNPVKDRLYIDYGTVTGGQVQVKIYSAGMQLVKQQEALAGGTITVSVNGLAAGVYFVRVEGKAGTQSFAIRKE